MFTRFAIAAALLVASSPAQMTRLHFAGLPTNLNADFQQVLWAPGSLPGEFYVLAPFGGAPASLFPFAMFAWNHHPLMQALYPGGWYEVQFHFPAWAYLSSAPCAQQPAPGQLLPHGGIDTTYDYGPSLFTGPLAVNFPLPGWTFGTHAIPRVGGLATTMQDESFQLVLRQYFGASLNACTGGTPVDWVAVQIRFDLVLH